MSKKKNKSKQELKEFQISYQSPSGATGETTIKAVDMTAAIQKFDDKRYPGVALVSIRQK